MEKWKFKLFSSSVERHDDTQAIVLAGFFFAFLTQKKCEHYFFMQKIRDQYI